MRKRQLQAQARAGNPTTFITLTSGPKAGASPSEAACALVAAWRVIRRDLRSRPGFGSVAFLAVFEATKRGRPHLHILARMPYLPQGWLSRRMAALAGSPIVDIRRVKNAAEAAAYVSKYLAKDPRRFTGCKRYWSSRDWSLGPDAEAAPVADANGAWHHDKRSMVELQRLLSRLGYWFWLKRGEMTFVWPWPNAPPYSAESAPGYA